MPIVRLLTSLITSSDISDVERRDPLVQRQLRHRFRRAVCFATAGTPPTLIGLVLVLWNRVDNRGLLAFVGLAMLGVVFNLIGITKLSLDHPRWLMLVGGMQVIGGVIWGALPLLAMPTNPAWHMFVAALILGVLASNVLFASHFRSTFYGFAVPVTLVGVVAFVMNGTAETRWGAALVLYAGVFSAGLAYISRMTHMDASVLTARARNLADGLAAANRRLTHQAATDSLTGLANRHTFAAALDKALDQDDTHTVAVAYLDLDGFKQINDNLGHGTGDDLLVAVTRRLADMLESVGVVARMGGDELTVLVTDVAGEDGARELGEFVLTCFAEPFGVEDRLMPVGCSVGVSLHQPGMDAASLVAAADQALYIAKGSGGSQVAVYGPAMYAAAAREAELKAELAEAVAAGDITTYFQPIVDLLTGEIVGLEALPRWLHVDGVRDARMFVDTAARTGLLDQINECVLNSVGEMHMHIALAAKRPIPIGVNIDPEQLGWVAERLASWHESDIDPFAIIMVEITERTTFTNMDEARGLVEQVRELGFQVLLDDVGTGLSSLAIATELAVDGVKLDRKFVSAVGHDKTVTAVVASLVGLSERLDFSLVAEGIETEAEAAALLDVGVSVGQGYLFSPAVPMSELADWLSSNRRFPVQAFSGGPVAASPARINQRS